MRVLVTGAAGFIGASVVRRLVAEGHEVGALVRPGGSGWRLEGVTSLTTIEADLADGGAVARALASWKPEACIHLAWYAVPGKYLDARENLDCLEVSLHLLESLAEAGCRHVVMTGTCAEYDTDLGFLRESGPTRPATLYAAAKLSLGMTAAIRAAQLGMTLSWARLFYLYGPYEDQRRMVPSLIRALLENKPFKASTGRQIRDYLHVDDVASALVALAAARANGTFNVCSGEPVRMRDLMATLGRFGGHEDVIRFGELPDREWEPPFICGDASRLRGATGWAPAYELEAGLRQTLEWWTARRKAEVRP
jgi:nucleoside-diphosphate-sugar epimerase